MLLNSSSNDPEFAGPGGQTPLSGPARRLRALREALRHHRFGRLNVPAGPSPTPRPTFPGKPPTAPARPPASARLNF
jgi:hypothetical protein